MNGPRDLATQPGDLTELRLLIELPALRKLADRGLSDSESAVVQRLAETTMRLARSGNVAGYLQADMAFHLHLLELTGNPALPEVARLLYARDLANAPHAKQSSHLMSVGAREHRELVIMLREDTVSMADDLLRHHVSRRWLGGDLIWPSA